MDILTSALYAWVAVVPPVPKGAGTVVDSLGVPVKGARITRLSDSVTVISNQDGRWSFDGDEIVVESTPRSFDGVHTIRTGGKMNVLVGEDRNLAGRRVQAGYIRAVKAPLGVRGGSVASDSVRVEAAGWMPTTVPYDSLKGGERIVLTMSSSRGMARIPGGFDSLGTSSQKNNPPHVVRVAGFWIDTFEVTQALFDSLMGFNPSYHRSCATCPVERVSWYDAVRFCNARSRAEKLPEVYDTSNPDSMLWTWDPASPGFRLPTDAEWEYAARAGSSSSWYWGPYINKEAVGQYAWYDQNAGDSTHPVGRLKPNDFGLHDVAGNVFEWTNDWFMDYGNDTLVYPKGAAQVGLWKGIRGGDFVSQNTSVTTVWHPPSLPNTRWLSLGFRCARGVMP